MSEETLDEMAMRFAMLAPKDYTAGTWKGDRLEHEAEALRMVMDIRFGEFTTYQAIQQAYEFLKIVDFHPERK